MEDDLARNRKEEPGRDWADIEQQEDEFPPYIPSSRYDEATVGCQWSHLSASRRFWEYLILTLALITPIEFSYVLIFDQTISPSDYVAFFIIDALHMIDAFVIIKTPISEHGILVTDPWRILDRYGRIPFFVYCVAALPFGWIGVMLRKIRVYSYLSIARLFRLHRAYRAYHRIDRSSLYGGTINHLWPYALLFVFIVHFFACASYLLVGTVSQEGMSAVEKYIGSIYFVTTVILTIGYGDIVPDTTESAMVVLIVEMIGVLLQTCLTAKMANAISDVEGNAFLQKYDSIQRFLKRHNRVGRKYTNHVRHYSQSMWEQTHGSPGWQELLADVPESIRNSIKLEICERAIYGMELWRGMTNSERIQLIDALEAVTFTPEEVICTQNEMLSDFLIFTSGTYRILRDGVLIARQMVTNSVYDGERELIFREPRSKTLIAETFVDGWRLKRSSLLHLVHADPQLRRLLMSNARRKYPRDFSGWSRRGDVFADENADDEPQNSLMHSA
jgi:hyperpolarization activated cyclic nucleotide-gated potassium channel 2